MAWLIPSIGATSMTVPTVVNVMAEVLVVAVGLDPRARPLLLLQEPTGARRVLPVWIGDPEATAIALEQQRVRLPRPPTHQLIADVIRAFGADLEAVRVTAVRDNQVEAELVLAGGTRVSARVSDAVALALHLRVPIEVAEPVLEQAGLTPLEVLISETAEANATGEAGWTAQAEIERFRRFLDTASPEDFDLG